MRFTEQVTLNFNDNMTTAAEKALDTTWHLGFLYKLSHLEVSISLLKLSSFLSQREFRVSPRNIRTSRGATPHGKNVELSL
jgi:hypothetical protein